MAKLTFLIIYRLLCRFSDRCRAPHRPARIPGSLTATAAIADRTKSATIATAANSPAGRSSPRRISCASCAALLRRASRRKIIRPSWQKRPMN